MHSHDPSVAYRGRFAPSPTGPLHFGSLIAALGSFADARAHDGDWLIRIEDLDRPREIPGAGDAILRTLEAMGFEWDGPVIRQSKRTNAYADALERLRVEGLTFPCTCSRRDIAQAGIPGADGLVYPGTCRTRRSPGPFRHSVRLRADVGFVSFHDRVQGRRTQDIRREVGDFVLRRADGIHAYQLAVIVDDADQGITQVVRGADLVLSTPRQVLLQRFLGLATPRYAHVPLAVDAAGRKLSKSDAAAPVDAANAIPALEQAWMFLGQEPLPERPATVEEFWRHAGDCWRIDRIPPRPTLPVPSRLAGRHRAAAQRTTGIAV